MRLALPLLILTSSILMSGESNGQGGWPTSSWPAWARVRDPDAVAQQRTDWSRQREAALKHGGYHFWLLDTAVRLDPAGTESILTREVFELHNEQGLDLIGDLTVTYVPTEEKLLLVHMRRRADESSPWELLQYRVRLERAGKTRGMYVDEQTVAFIPEGLRATDQVDFAYLIIRKMKVERWDWLESDGHSAFVGSRSLEVQLPAGVSLQTSAKGFEQPKVSRDESGTRVNFDVDYLNPAIVEEWIPDRFEPFKKLSMSTISSWREIGGNYFEQLSTYAISPRVASMAAEIAASKADPVSAVAGWIQSNIRYVGIETASHRLLPTDPSLTLERGYGDCKDMSLLLVQMLRSLGERAWPAMVRTPDLGPVDPQVPMLNAFNHEIVAVERGGDLVFIDPTIKEAVPPWSGSMREGARVLVIDGVSSLATVGPQPDELDSVDSVVRAVEADGTGIVGAGELVMEVETSYGGPALTAMRRRLIEGRPEVLGRQAADYFRRAVYGRTMLDVSHDYSGAGEAVTPLKIRERFRFSAQDPAIGCTLRYLPPEISEWFQHVSVTGRVSPVGLSHPRKTRVELSFKAAPIEAIPLPESFVHDDGFVRISRESKRNDGEIVTVWSAQSLRDVVPLEQLPAFVSGLDRASIKSYLDLCGHPPALSRNMPVEPGAGILIWLLALGASAMSLALGLLVGFVLGRRRGKRAAR